MASSIKLTKQKYSQNDLRRLMQEQKAKKRGATSENKQKIDSPLAKYNELGQLTCVLCKTVVRSEDVWKVHLNAKQHRENILAAKELKEKTLKQTAPKRPAPTNDSEFTEFIVPEKKIKGILKNAGPQTSITIPITVPQPQPIPEKMETEEDLGDNHLPEGFFDDPKKDAIARNLEYKDPVEEEWEKFQKEIKEAASKSNDIIAEDQEESTAERQIVEIDEQIKNWSRVLTMEKKKEETIKHLEKFKLKPQKPLKDRSSDEESESDEEQNKNVTEFVDWRAKGWK